MSKVMMEQQSGDPSAQRKLDGWYKLTENWTVIFNQQQRSIPVIPRNKTSYSKLMPKVYAARHNFELFDDPLMETDQGFLSIPVCCWVISETLNHSL